MNSLHDLGLNPLAFNSLKNIDIETFEDDLARELQKQKYYNERDKKNIQKILDESEEIKEWRKKIKIAHLNKERSLQIKESQLRKLDNLVKDAEIDEQVLNKLEEENAKEQKNENVQKLKALHNKYVLQKQMKDRAEQLNDAKYEYLRDKQQVEDIVNKIAMEDLQALEIEKAKKNQARKYMEMSYKEKEEKKIKEKLLEEEEKAKQNEYFNNVAKRNNEYKAKKQAIQSEKDKIFERLCEEKKRQEAEKEYWEDVRNELYVEEHNRKLLIKELEEKEKKARQRELMLSSAIEQANLKEERKLKEQEKEKEFKKKLLEKYKSDEKLEQFNAIRRKQKELEYKQEIEKQWKLKLEEFRKQKEYELMLLKNKQEEEIQKREFIEREKNKLIKENEDILKNYLTKDYLKATLNSSSSNSNCFNNNIEKY